MKNQATEEYLKRPPGRRGSSFTGIRTGSTKVRCYSVYRRLLLSSAVVTLLPVPPPPHSLGRHPYAGCAALPTRVRCIFAPSPTDEGIQWINTTLLLLYIVDSTRKGPV